MSITARMFKGYSHDEWLRLRHQDVTASAVGALLGDHPYQTPLSLYAEKIKPEPAGGADNGVFRRGRWLEAAAIKAARELRPKWEITEPACYLRDEANRIGCTPDAYYVNDDGECGALQIKTVAPEVFKKTWYNGEEQLQIPFWIVLQSYVEARLSGFYRAAVGALVYSDWDPQMHIFEFECPEQSYIRIAKEVARFWRQVEQRKPPEADHARDLEALASLYTGAGPSVDKTGDEKFGKLLDEEAAIKARRDAAVTDMKTCKARILEAMGNAEAVRHGRRLVTYKEQSRKGYQVQPTSFRVLRISEPSK